MDRERQLIERFEDWFNHHRGNPDPVEARRQFALGGVLWEVVNGRQTTELAARSWELFRVDPDDPNTLIIGDDPVLEFALAGADDAATPTIAMRTANLTRARIGLLLSERDRRDGAVPVRIGGIG